jgi:hypothetical protein
VLALVAPEMVLWRAYTQWKNARQLCKLINALPERARPSSRWTMENGFFAVMGGYRIREMKDWPNGCTLTPRGVYFLAKLKSLPAVDKESILDRSKADELVKGLACCQALWLVIQVIARKASGLPITLLELNTVAHVVCAILMYIVWWHKPQDVNQPEFVDVRDPGLDTLLSESSTIWGELGIPPSIPQDDMIGDESGDSHTRQKPSDQRSPDGDTDWRQALPKNESGIRVVGDIAEHLIDYRHQTLVAIKERIKPAGTVMLVPGQRLEGSRFTVWGWPVHLTTEEVQFIQSISQIRGLEFLDTPLEIRPRYYSSYISPQAPNIEVEGDVILERDSMYMWPASFGSFLPMLAILSIFYGGLHATSWNSHFPTAIEHQLWRIASCVVAGGGLVLWAMDSVFETWLWTVNLDVEWLWTLLCAMISLIFAAARVYLVIESFISVRSLPVGAFTSIAWVNFLPHVG